MSSTPSRQRISTPLRRDASDLAIRRLLLIPQLSPAADTESVKPIIQSIRNLSPLRRNISDVRGLFGGLPVNEFDRSPAALSSSTTHAGSRQGTPHRSGTRTNSVTGGMLDFMGPPSLQLSKGVLSSITAYQPLDDSNASNGEASFIIAEGRPPTPMTPAMMRAANDRGAVEGQYAIGREGERAIREGPLVAAQVAKVKAKLAADPEGTYLTQHQRILIQRGPDDWFQRRSEGIRIRFRVCVPQLLMYPLLFPSIDSATTYFPNSNPLISLNTLIANTTADQLVARVGAAIREQLIAPAALAAGGIASPANTIYESLLGTGLSGPSDTAIGEQVLSPFRGMMAAFEHKHINDRLVIAWPLEKPQATTIVPNKGQFTKSVPTPDTHTFLYLTGNHVLSSFPLVSAWSRSLLLLADRYQPIMVDIFVNVREGQSGDKEHL